MARFAATGLQSAVAGTDKTILELLGGTGHRLSLYDAMWGASGTPADQALVYSIIRITASGTGTAIAESPLDPADAAATAAVEENHTVEPTTSGEPLIELPVNLRASYRWVAAPGSEIIVAATAGAGLADRVRSAGYTGQAESSIMWEE